MAIKLKLASARQYLALAVTKAKAGEVPTEWVGLTESVWRFSAKTYVPALGTVLLAKATEPAIDPGSIKEQPENPQSYSMRTLCHSVLVPSSHQYGFSIRTTGREPLNNQPFFRYLHVDEIVRVRASEELTEYKKITNKVADLTHEAAIEALAAFVATGMAQKQSEDALTEVSPGETASRLLSNLEKLLERGVGGPHITQALGSVLLENIYPETRARRLNDPSRDFPGDCQGVDADGKVVASLEARNKPVSDSDARAFIAACARHGIRRAMILQVGAEKSPLDVRSLFDWAWVRHSVSFHLVLGVESAITQLLAWAPDSPDSIVERLNSQVAIRLKEIEAPVPVRTQWTELCLQHHESGDTEAVD